MALGTEEATFNAAIDTALVAWEAMIDALSANEEIHIVWIDSKKGDNADDSRYGEDTTAKYSFSRVYRFQNRTDVTNDMPFEIGGKPLFFKITNAAQELS